MQAKTNQAAGSLLSLAVSRPSLTATLPETRRRILSHAAAVASQEGLEGLTIGRLAAGLGMSKSGLIAHFGARESLQLAAIEFASDLFVQEVVLPVFDTNRGLARLRALLACWLGYVERSVFPGGCFFMAASLEMDGRPGPVRERIRQAAKWWFDVLEQEIVYAIGAGELPETLDAAQLAFELHAAVQEANWGSQLFGGTAWYSRARAVIDARLAAKR